MYASLSPCLDGVACDLHLGVTRTDPRAEEYGVMASEIGASFYVFDQMPVTTIVNLMVGHTDGDLILALDDDVLFGEAEQDWVKRAIAYFEAESDGIMGILPVHSEEEVGTPRFVMTTRRVVTLLGYYAVPLFSRMRMCDRWLASILYDAGRMCLLTGVPITHMIASEHGESYAKGKRDRAEEELVYSQTRSVRSAAVETLSYHKKEMT